MESLNIVAWVVIFFSALAASCAIDFLLGKHFHAKNWRNRDYPPRNGQLQLFTRGPELFDQYFEDIRQARSSVHILFYIVQNDPFSGKFLEILMERAQEGIEVRLLIDWLGSRKASKKLISKARDLGVEVVFCHRPRLPFLFFSLQQRNHRKITVIDGKIGYLGGYNVGNEYIDLDPELTPWRDYHLRIQGEGVADLQRVFLVDWERAKGKMPKNRSSLFPTLDSGPAVYRLFPTEGVNAEDHLIQMFEQAKSTIFIGTPYFIPPKKMIAALERALDKGVKLTVLVPENSDHFLVKEASFRYLRRVLKKGGTVCQFQHGFFHAKVLMIDGKICDIGTSNFDYRSFLLNHEINCFIYDPHTFIPMVQEELAKDISLSTRLSYDDLKNLRFPVRMQEWLGKVSEIFL